MPVLVGGDVAINPSGIAISKSVNPWYNTGNTLAASVVLYYKMNESSGSRSPTVGSGTLTDGSSSIGSATGLMYPLAASFDGAANSHYLNTADNATVSTGDINFWLAAWCYFSSKPTTSEATVISKWDNVTPLAEYSLVWDKTADAFRFYVSPNGTTLTNEVEFTGSPATGTWHLLMAYHDATNDLIGISLNGAAFTTSAYSSGLTDTTTPFRVGGIATASGGNVWKGRIGPITMGKSYIPTAADAAYLYNSGIGLA